MKKIDILKSFPANLTLIVAIILFYTMTLWSQQEASTQDSLSLPSSIMDTTNIDTTLAAERADSLPYHLERVIHNNAFRVGEKLTFVVRYGIIKAGEATMAVEELVPVGKRTAYKIVSTAKSARAFDLFFKVRDKVESYIDTRGIFSWRFNKMLREGSYKFDLLVDYNQYYGKANVESIRYEDSDDLKIKESDNFELNIPPYVLDILASFYYVRTQKLRVGMPIYLTNHDNKKVYDLKVFIQRREVIKVDAGKFRCIVVQPVLRGEALFKQKGQLWVWLTDDQYKIPVQMKSAVFVGSITTELTKIEGVSLPLPSQIK
jgi:hypothetical protein